MYISHLGKLKITKHPGDMILKVCNGCEQVVLVCEIEGDGMICTEWKRENQPVRSKDIISRCTDSSIITSTLTVTNARPSDSGKYHCAVKNQWCDTISNPAQVTVKSMWPVKYNNYIKSTYFEFTMHIHMHVMYKVVYVCLFTKKICIDLCHYTSTHICTYVLLYTHVLTIDENVKLFSYSTNHHKTTYSAGCSYSPKCYIPL